MYRYDEFDEALVRARVRQFRGQVARRLSGALSEDQFKPLRLMNGLYLQLHAYMLRVAVPYGTLSSRQLRQLAMIARRFDKGYGHFTTRQNIQYNWPRLVDTPDILEALADVEMHCIQTSGNCIRNVTSDPYAGAAEGEIEDPRIWCEIIRQWSSFHPEFSFLPRKFKIAATACEEDRAAILVHDIGVVLVKNAGGETGFRVFAGGGQGRTPMIAKEMSDFVSRRELLAFLEAILRVYNRHGRRDNLFKSRIKILVHALGADEMRRQVAEEFERTRTQGPLALPDDEIDAIRAYFAPPDFATLPENAAEYTAALETTPAFARWAETNTARHKIPGYAIVNISLKPQGGAPGDMTAAQMDAVADLADTYAFGEIRVTHEQNLVLAHVEKRRLHELWLALDALRLATPNISLITDQICCPGLDYCNLANTRSIPLAQKISHRFADPARQKNIGELKIKISGCINACGHHHVGHIGVLGVDKKGKEAFQILLGGAADENASLGKIIGPALTEDGVLDAIETLVKAYTDMREDGERFIDTWRRVGTAPFKDRLDAASP